MNWWRKLLALEWSAPAPAQQRTAEFGDSSIPSWSAASGGLASSGVLVTSEKAVGLPAVAQAIRQPAVLAAGLPLDVYDVSPDRKQRTLSRGKWQNDLLDQPDSMRSGFDFWSDLISHVDGYGNAYALKMRDGGRVVELVLMDPERMKVEVDKVTRARTFCYYRETGEKVEIPAANVLHVRGWDPLGTPQARSPVERHRDSIGKSAARTRFEERFLSNDARPGVVITMPQVVTRDQAQEYLDMWDARHRMNPGKPTVLGGGATIQTLPVSFRDAQFIEAESFNVEDIARIYDWPADLLGRETDRDFVQVMAWAVRLHLMPRLQRVEASLGDDPDLFGSRSKFRPFFDVSELLRGDAGTMASVFHQLVQVGVMTPNEARMPLGLPPIEGGDELQATPVGGAPNNSAGSVAPSGPAGSTEPETSPPPE